MKEFDSELFGILQMKSNEIMRKENPNFMDGAITQTFEEYLISSYELLIKMRTLYEASKFSSVEFNEDYFPQIIEIEKDINSIQSINHFKF